MVAVYTYDDLLDGVDPDDPTVPVPAVAQPLPLLIPHPALTAPRTGYPLAREEVNHVGEPVVMVVATDRYVAEDACERIVVTYEFLPAVVGIDAARAAERTVHADVPDNVAAHLVQEVGDLDAAMAAAPHTLTLDLEIERSACMPMEGKGVYAVWNGDEDSIRVYTSTQAATSVRMAVAAKLEMAANKVECIAPDVGGGFGVKIVHPWPEEVLVPWAARRLARAGIAREVKWTEDRREHFISSAHERGQQQRVTAGFDDDGRLLALDFTFWHDNGAYTPYGIIVPIITSTQVLGPYKPRAYRVQRLLAVHQHRDRHAVPRRRPSAGRVRDGAHDGRDRRRARQGPHRRPRGQPHHPGRDAVRPPAAVPGRQAAGLRLGRLPGVDGEDQGAGGLGRVRGGARAGAGRGPHGRASVSRRTSRAPARGPYEGAHVVVETSGKVKVATGLTTQGQGHQTSFAQIVADQLGVDVADVEVVTGDTRRFRYAVGTFASRAAVMSGSAMHVAAGKVRDKALRIAADALEVDVDDLELVDGVARVKGTPAGGPGTEVPLATLAVLSNPLRYAFDTASQAATQFSVGDHTKPPVPEGEEPGLEATGYYSPNQSTFASGIHAVVVETDPLTAEVRILRYCVVHDCGTLVNPKIVEGQIHGGVAQGVGGALYERIVYDEHGQVLNASYMDFLMPYATEVPARIEIDHLETPSPLNPLGIKGAGEAGVIPSAALFASAIEDAEGFPIRSMPLSPSDLFELRRQHADSGHREDPS